MAGGDLYKALNRGSSGLSTIWDNIINTVLGNRQKKLIQPVTKQQEPILPETGASQVPINTEQQVQDASQPYLPDQTKTDLENIDTQFKQDQLNQQQEQPYIPDGSGQGEAGGQSGDGKPDTNQVYAPNIYIPTGKTTTKPKTTPSGKLDAGGLKYTVGSKTSDQQSNKQLTNDLLNYIAETSKFGARGQPFINTALSAIYPLSYKQGAPPPPKMTGHEFVTDKEGNLLQYVFDPTTRQYNTVPVLDQAGNPVKQKLPEFDKGRIQVTADENGNAVLYDMQSGNKTDTGMSVEDFDKQYGLEKDKFEFDKQYKTALLEMKANKQKGGKGDGSSSITGDKVVWDLETGMPVDLGDTESPLSKIIQGMYSGSKKTREQNTTLFNLYYGNKYSLADTKIAKSLIPKIRDAGEQYKSGKVTKEQFDTYIKTLQAQYPSEMSWLRKNYAR